MNGGNAWGDLNSLDWLRTESRMSSRIKPENCFHINPFALQLPRNRETKNLRSSDEIHRLSSAERFGCSSLLHWFSHFPHDSLFSSSLILSFCKNSDLTNSSDRSHNVFFCRLQTWGTADRPHPRKLKSINATMGPQAANHILAVTLLTTSLAILLSAAPATINHAEVSRSRNSFYRRARMNV